MHDHPLDESLSQVPIFSQLGPKELENVRNLFTGVSLEAGFVLARQGDRGREFFVVETGTAKVERDGQVIAEVGPGDFQGEFSLLDGGPRSATVTATSPMTVLVCNHGEFMTLLEEFPSIAQQMLPVIVGRLRAMASDPHDRSLL
jgi:CRP/FNR family transcriptional regulator, cyclic AMP receptor protein